MITCSSEPSYAVGDCVTIERRLLDYDLNAADCADAVGSLVAAERTYKVDEVLDDLDGGCPMLQGFFPVEFTHESDGVTYCLSMAP
jgi:hypothetical protein